MTVIERSAADRSVSLPRLQLDGRSVELTALWLLACSNEDFDLDPSSRQRLFDPSEVDEGLSIVGYRDADGVLSVDFSDGRTRTFERSELERRAVLADPEAPPCPDPWETLNAVPSIDWTAVVSNDAPLMRAVLDGYFRLGCFTVTGTPTERGSLHDIAGRFGRVAATNFGTLFDVESTPQPIDLAYSAAGLAAHTDQPYRRPTPGLQFLHTLYNDAPGGASTMTDGLAGTLGLRDADPEAFEALCDLDVEFRYDIGVDVVANQAPVIDLDRHGRLRQLRFSPRLDMPPLTSAERLSAWFRGRRWLSTWFDDPTHHVEFKMETGDVLVVDNHRVLHGRRPFDAAGGRRHLQGCYIDHDGPATMWAMLNRQPDTPTA